MSIRARKKRRRASPVRALVTARRDPALGLEDFLAYAPQLVTEGRRAIVVVAIDERGSPELSSFGEVRGGDLALAAVRLMLYADSAE